MSLAAELGTIGQIETQMPRKPVPADDEVAIVNDLQCVHSTAAGIAVIALDHFDYIQTCQYRPGSKVFITFFSSAKTCGAVPSMERRTQNPPATLATYQLSFFSVAR